MKNKKINGSLPHGNSTTAKSYRFHTVKYPDASIRGIKLETMQASGYLTLAAFAKWTRERVRLAHCPRE